MPKPTINPITPAMTSQGVRDHIQARLKEALNDGGPISPHEWLTPAFARIVIDELNEHNRPISRQLSADMRESMIAKDFPETGENGITFDRDGILFGGQHTADALAGIEDPQFKIRLRVTYGVRPQDRSHTNGSRPQRFAHDLAIAGVKQATQQEALLRVAVLWDRTALMHKGQGGLAGFRTSKKLSRIELTREWPKYAAELVATMQETGKWNSSDVWPGNRGAMQFTWWLLRYRVQAPEAAIAEFYNKVSLGVGMDEQEATLFQKLRARLHDSDEKHVQVFWILKIWALWLKGDWGTKIQAPKGSVDKKGNFTPFDPYPRIPKR